MRRARAAKVELGQGGGRDEARASGDMARGGVARAAAWCSRVRAEVSFPSGSRLPSPQNAPSPARARRPPPPPPPPTHTPPHPTHTLPHSRANQLVLLVKLPGFLLQAGTEGGPTHEDVRQRVGVARRCRAPCAPKPLVPRPRALCCRSRCPVHLLAPTCSVSTSPLAWYEACTRAARASCQGFFFGGGGGGRPQTRTGLWGCR